MLRGLSEPGLADWRRLEQTRFFERFVDERKIVATEVADEAPPGWPGALRHERVPLVTYPYEWTFAMLQDAALLQLDLMLAALEEDFILKDATPYNVQFVGARPVFIDVGSFEPLDPGQPWEGYRQFCMLFLYPLLLQAWKDVPFAPWLRGSVEGIEPRELRGLLSARDRLRRGAFTHVFLHARLDARYAGREHVRSELRKAGFRKELIVANVRKLRNLVAALEWSPGTTTWSEYGTTTTYSDEDARRKQAFVREAAAARRRRMLWDLGANDGTYTRVAAEHADYAVAFDADAAVIDRLYRVLRSEPNESILPLAVDLTNPSPGTGWRARERQPLWERGNPDLVLALALVHHVAVSGNVPLAEIVDWLRSLEATAVVEFVGPEDPMARRLIERKKEGTHDDYTRDVWERLLCERFDVERSEELGGGARVLYRIHPRA